MSVRIFASASPLFGTMRIRSNNVCMKHLIFWYVVNISWVRPATWPFKITQQKPVLHAFSAICFVQQVGYANSVTLLQNSVQFLEKDQGIVVRNHLKTAIVLYEIMVVMHFITN